MDDIELIKQKINIVDLISEYLPLKKAGVNFKASCPFHSEKTPSFMVSPERGIFKCFGCLAGGDVFKFLMLKEGIDFPEALEILAKKAGVVLKRQINEKKDSRTRLFEANQKAAQFFHYLLTEHKLGRAALEYLKGRGVTEKTITDFNLGYAPNSWESLTKFLLKRGFQMSEIIEAGLAIPSRRGGYDRFRGRVIFPLIDVKNQVIGFSGRILGVGEPASTNVVLGGPKYINTSQTPLFDKSNFLFGINLAKGEIRIKKQAILVEGEMDMILSYQAGIKNIIASKGTALTAGQIELIKRYAEEILLCFDADLAGDSAARRGIEMADAAGLSMSVIKIDGGKDPADLVKKNPETWQRAVEEAEPIYDYYLQSVIKRYNLKTAEGKKKAAAELLPIWSKITNPIHFEDYLQKLSALLQISEEICRKEIKKVSLPQAGYENLLRERPAEKILMTASSRRTLLEEYLLILLLKIPQEVTYVPDFPESIFLTESYKSIYVLLVLYLDAISFKAASFKIADFSQGLSEDLVPLVDTLYLKEIDERLLAGKAWKKEVDEVVAELKKALIKASLAKLSAEIKNAQVFGKIEQLEILNKRFRDLSVKLKNF